MHLNAKLDVEVVAVEAEDELSVLLELQAPQSQAAVARPPRTLQIVLDRSGSMAGAPLENAKRALFDLVGRLDAQDRFGLVVFDDQVDVVVPSAAVGDGHAARTAIAGVHPGGMTNLSAGLIRGIEEARRTKGDVGATLLLLSDGHANAGQTDPAVLGDYAQGIRRDGVTLGGIGIGLHYDERVLSAIAAGGAGNIHFAEDADGIGGALAQEVDGLLDQVVQAVSLRVTPSDAVRSVTLFNDLPTSTLDDGFVVELGDFAAGETRKLVLRADIPALQDLGLLQVCRMTLRWTEVDTMTTKSLSLPLQVGVVPGDQAAGRVAKPEVRTEYEFQRAQKSRAEAADALRRGERDLASRLLRDAGDGLMAASLGAPPELLAEMQDEAAQFQEDADRTMVDDANRSAKYHDSRFNAMTRKRQAMAEMEAEHERRYGGGEG